MYYCQDAYSQYNCPLPNGAERGSYTETTPPDGGKCVVTTNCDGTTKCELNSCNTYRHNALLAVNSSNPGVATVKNACGWTVGVDVSGTVATSGAGSDWMSYCCSGGYAACSSAPINIDNLSSYLNDFCSLVENTRGEWFIILK